MVKVLNAREGVLARPLARHVVRREEERAVGHRERHADTRHERHLRRVVAERAFREAIGSRDLSRLTTHEVADACELLARRVKEAAFEVAEARDGRAAAVDGEVAIDASRCAARQREPGRARARQDVVDTVDVDERERVDELPRVVVEHVEPQAKVKHEVLELDAVAHIAAVVERVVRRDVAVVTREEVAEVVRVGALEPEVVVAVIPNVPARVVEAVARAEGQLGVRPRLRVARSVADDRARRVADDPVASERAREAGAGRERARRARLELTAERQFVDADLRLCAGRRAELLLLKLGVARERDARPEERVAEAARRLDAAVGGGEHVAAVDEVVVPPGDLVRPRPVNALGVEAAVVDELVDVRAELVRVRLREAVRELGLDLVEGRVREDLAQRHEAAADSVLRRREVFAVEERPGEGEVAVAVARVGPAEAQRDARDRAHLDVARRRELRPRIVLAAARLEKVAVVDEVEGRDRLRAQRRNGDAERARERVGGDAAGHAAGRPIRVRHEARRAGVEARREAHVEEVGVFEERSLTEREAGREAVAADADDLRRVLQAVVDVVAQAQRRDAVG